MAKPNRRRIPAAAAVVVWTRHLADCVYLLRNCMGWAGKGLKRFAQAFAVDADDVRRSPHRIFAHHPHTFLYRGDHRRRVFVSVAPALVLAWFLDTRDRIGGATRVGAGPAGVFAAPCVFVAGLVGPRSIIRVSRLSAAQFWPAARARNTGVACRSEEHTSE